MPKRMMAAAGLVAVTLAACEAATPTPSPSPNRRQIRRDALAARVDCSKDYFFWGGMEEFSRSIESYRDEPHEVAKDYAEFWDFKFDAPHVAERACRLALESALELTDEGRAAKWKPWGDEERWFEYWSIWWSCYRLTGEKRLYGFAEWTGTVTVTPESIAKEWRDGHVHLHDPAEAGCRDGIYAALEDFPRARPQPASAQDDEG